MRNWINARRLWVSGFLLFWFCYFTYFWMNAAHINDRGGLSVTNVNIWGDWAAHFTMGSHLAYNNFFPQTSPLVIGQSFSYPFAAEWISAGLVRLGVPFISGFILPSYLLSVVLVVTLYKFYERVFESWKVSLLASTIFLLNGGLGFIYYIQDVLNATDRWRAVLNPQREYTNLEPLFIRWISVTQSMIIPQRAFTLGFPCALIFLTLLVTLYKKHKLTLLQSSIAGIILGLLPIIHTHSFLAVSIIAGCWFLASIPSFHKNPTLLKSWLVIGGIGVSVAATIVNAFFLSHVSSGFIKWFPGWYAFQFPELNWFHFWLLNWSLVPVVAITEFLLITWNSVAQKKFSKVGIWFPFVLLFVLLNLFLFQPFIWDNTKILVWASVGFSGMTAYWFYRSWVALKKSKLLLKIVGSTVLLLLFSVIIFSGTVDTYRVLRFNSHTYEMYSAEELSLAEWAKHNTPANAIWMTGDQHNHWLFNLTGRQPLMTYRGWLWTHGYKYHAIDADQNSLYQNPQANLAIIDKYSIRYVVVGPNEKEVWKANERELRSVFSVIKQTRNYLILEKK